MAQKLSNQLQPTPSGSLEPVPVSRSVCGTCGLTCAQHKVKLLKLPVFRRQPSRRSRAKDGLVEHFKNLPECEFSCTKSTQNSAYFSVPA